MPTYDYVCDACGHAFEHFQAMSAKPLRTCPKCAKRKLVRQVGAGAGLIFKGSGWYATDYRKSPSPPAEPKGAAEPKASTEGKGGKGCGKPACGSSSGTCASGDGNGG